MEQPEQAGEGLVTFIRCREVVEGLVLCDPIPTHLVLLVGGMVTIVTILAVRVLLERLKGNL